MVTSQEAAVILYHLLLLLLRGNCYKLNAVYGPFLLVYITQEAVKRHCVVISCPQLCSYLSFNNNKQHIQHMGLLNTMEGQFLRDSVCTYIIHNYKEQEDVALFVCVCT